MRHDTHCAPAGGLRGAAHGTARQVVVAADLTVFLPALTSLLLALLPVCKWERANERTHVWEREGVSAREKMWVRSGGIWQQLFVSTCAHVPAHTHT